MLLYVAYPKARNLLNDHQGDVILAFRDDHVGILGPEILEDWLESRILLLHASSPTSYII